MDLSVLNWPQVASLSKDIPVVVPVAALEQHGKHLPLFTDSMLLGEVIRRASEQLKDRVLFTPLLWLGNSAHHMDFPGTLTASPRTYIDLLCDLMEALITHGLRRIVFINGHGGNMVPGQQAIFEVRQRHRDRDDLLLLFASYWGLGGKPHETPVVARSPDRATTDAIRQTHMMHACEWETSMMLRLAPQLVTGHEEAKPVEHGRAFEPAARGWITKDRSEAGHIGDPCQATAEKGEALFRVFTNDVVELLNRVIAWKGQGWEE